MSTEVFYHDGADHEPGDCWSSEDGEPLPSGWYYWYCEPGCLPDSDPIGPYASEAEADQAVQDDLDEAEAEYRRHYITSEYGEDDQ